METNNKTTTYYLNEPRKDSINYGFDESGGSPGGSPPSTLYDTKLNRLVHGQKKKRRQSGCSCKVVALAFIVLALLAVIAILAYKLILMMQMNSMMFALTQRTDWDSPYGPDAMRRLSADSVSIIKKDLIDLINGKIVNGARPRIAGWVRLAFHDCVGNCDGCVDVDNPMNAGLDNYISDLEPVYNKYRTIISHADFWQLAGITALEASSQNCEKCIKPWIQFVAGRRDCSTAPYYHGPNHNFPDAHGDIDDVLGFFDVVFGLPRNKPELAVALMGAHSLGRAHGSASGWKGPWVEDEDHLNPNYYKDMLTSEFNWTQMDHGPDPQTKRFTWHRVTADGTMLDHTMMMNADMCMHRVISPDSSGKASCLVANTCPQQPHTAGLVELYATDLNAWQRNFAAAYFKMITTGYDVDRDLYIPDSV